MEHRGQSISILLTFYRVDNFGLNDPYLVYASTSVKYLSIY